MTDKIKNFFEKRRREGKFKGQGHKLNELPAQVSKHKDTEKLSQERTEPCQQAKQAGLAALARFENKSHPGLTTSFAAQYKLLKEEAIMEARGLSEDNLIGECSNPSNVKEILAVQGVYFKCPLIGPEILPKEDWKAKIKQFLYDQLESEKGFTACLMIHSLNKNKDKVEQCIDTLCTYLQNIINHSDEGKFKRIRVNNRHFQERVMKIIGTHEFLEAAGFVRESILVNGDQEEYYVFESSQDMSHLELMIDTLRNSEAIPLELDRNIKVLKPVEAKVRVQLPDDFYALTPDEIKREQKKKTVNLETNMQLRTKAMRDKEEQREIRKYRYSLIRVRFPDGQYLQSTFGIYERLAVVKELISENIAENVGEFSLTTALGVLLPESEDSKSLLELKLVPAVIITFVPKNLLEEGQSYLIETISKNPENLEISSLL